MTTRIAIGGIAHETNEYVASPTTLDRFHVARGEEIVTGAQGSRTYLGGMIDAARDIGAEVVPTLSAIAGPWGTITAATYDALKDELVERIVAAGADAVALDLHGAGVAEGVPDLEGDLATAVREAVGPDVPIVVTHDLHGNITRTEAEAVDAMFGVHHYPHDDMYERGREAIDLIPRLLAGELHPVIHVERLPMLLPTTTTYQGAMVEINELCWSLEDKPGVIDCTFMHGFPYTDNVNVGSQVVVTTDGDADLARTVAREVAEAVWARRDDFLQDHPDPAEAIERALVAEGRPVVINETSDNPGGGTPCDGTHLLRAMIEADLDDAVFVGIFDPEVVEQAHEAGVGATIDVRLGGKTDDLHGTPIEATATVRILTDGEYTVEAPMGRGSRVPLGRTALLRVGKLDVIVISRGVQTIDRGPLILHGIDPTQRKVVALKSSNHFRSGFQDLAAAIVTTDPPGLTTLKMDTFAREISPRPIWPIDPDATYPASWAES
ncbi:MAG TPA: M81 family metallopeptidase [Nitriliruptorales bacterium]